MSNAEAGREQAAPHAAAGGRTAHLVRATLFALGQGVEPWWTISKVWSQIKKVEWVDTKWDHEQLPDGGFLKTRTGDDVEITITYPDGSKQTHKIKKGERVAKVDDELRLIR
jgi:hypothetical protein